MHCNIFRRCDQHGMLGREHLCLNPVQIFIYLVQYLQFVSGEIIK